MSRNKVWPSSNRFLLPPSISKAMINPRRLFFSRPVGSYDADTEISSHPCQVLLYGRSAQGESMNTIHCTSHSLEAGRISIHPSSRRAPGKKHEGCLKESCAREIAVAFTNGRGNGTNAHPNVCSPSVAQRQPYRSRVRQRAAVTLDGRSA
jgi:hypothetical protein